MLKYFFSILITGLAILQPSVVAQHVSARPTHLTTDNRANPLGVGANPVFGWNLKATVSGARGVMQGGYRIRLATSEANLHRPGLVVWDSGRIASSADWQRPYSGPALASGTTYFWQVQAWTADGSPGPWSRAASFTTALLREEDWHAQWIAAEPDRVRAANPPEQLLTDPPPLPVFRKELALRKPVAKALLFVSGLGQYEVRVNGRNVTDNVMTPGWTAYRKTVLYDTYDVTSFLRSGVNPVTNALTVLLGNGMYNVQDVKGHYIKFAGSFGQPKVLLQIEIQYADGSVERVVSDRSWTTHPGPVTYSSIFGGETYDAAALPANWDQAGADTAGWQQALEVAGPGGRLLPQQTPPLFVAQTYTPVAVTHPRPDVAVYDLGQTMSGWPAVHVRGPAGSRVDLLAGELLNEDGTVSQQSANAFPQDPVLFRYGLRGANAGEMWHPRFSYYSFRYVQVTTSAVNGVQPQVLSLTGQFTHARVAQAGSFDTSNQLFQRIHTLIDRAVLSNLASIVTDCPSREKLGWLEETYLNAGTLMLNYDVTGIYEKMSGDMQDAQLPSGLVPSIAPEYVAFVDAQGQSNAFRDSPEWGSAVVLSPWALYQYTADMRPLEQHYTAMRRYVAYLRERAHDGLLNYGLGDWYDIGPKEPGPSQLTSKTLTASGVFFEDLVAMQHIANLLGHPDDAAEYGRQAAEVERAYNASLFHAATEQYDRGSQTANAIPLALGLVPAEHVQGVLAHLVEDIHAHQDHVTAGDVGFHYVVRALTKYGRSDVLAAMFSRTDSPSYGYQLARGATTLAEAWDANPRSSQNHFMLGHGEEWFYRGLAGLQIDMAKGAEHAVQLQPSFLDGVAMAAASYRTPMGVVRLKWQKTESHRTVEVTVPEGAVAELVLPLAQAWLESGRSASVARGILSHVEMKDGMHLRLGSGRYLFSASGVAVNKASPADRLHVVPVANDADFGSRNSLA